jgi:hypothetical protein
VRRIREDRFLEHIFPITRKFLLRSDAPGKRARAATGSANDNPLANVGAARRTGLERGQIDLAKRLYQAKSGFLVKTERVPLHNSSIAEMQPNRFSLGDQIANGENEPVIDQHTIASALDTEGIGGKGIGWDNRMQANH